MTVPTTIDAGAWIGNYLTGEDADGDLARAMLKAFLAWIHANARADRSWLLGP